MRTKNVTRLLTFAFVNMIAMAAISSLSLNYSVASQEYSQTFTARPLVPEEVPATNNVRPSVIAEFRPDMEQQNILYEVNTTSLDNVTAVHIHEGNKSQIGRLLVTLFEADLPVRLMTGTLVQGNITEDELEGPMEGKQISDLVLAMRNRSTFVNLHTEQYPNGKILGNIVGSQR